ncbi:uncharacterized protein LOC135270837 isoform X2 [Aotus nancymaae]|uniref:uncharacterized protein LOC135270837 isoform X2 n=1 Tax=Aotus nancymaae TaxID=37293 RepID=UPI0030FE5C5B
MWGDSRPANRTGPFRSLCAILLAWQYSMADSICWNFARASSSVTWLRYSHWCRSPPERDLPVPSSATTELVLVVDVRVSLEEVTTYDHLGFQIQPLPCRLPGWSSTSGKTRVTSSSIPMLRTTSRWPTRKPGPSPWVSLCNPGWSAVLPSQLTATSASQAEAILPPRPPSIWDYRRKSTRKARLPRCFLLKKQQPMNVLERSRHDRIRDLQYDLA